MFPFMVVFALPFQSDNVCTCIPVCHSVCCLYDLMCFCLVQLTKAQKELLWNFREQIKQSPEVWVWVRVRVCLRVWVRVQGHVLLPSQIKSNLTADALVPAYTIAILCNKANGSMLTCHSKNCLMIR